MCACFPIMAALFTKDKKERWWLVSFRYIRDRLFSTNRGSTTQGSQTSNGSGGSGGSRPNRSAYSKHMDPKNSDVVELESLRMDGTSGHSVPAPGPDEIVRATTIQQQWSDQDAGKAV